MKFLCGGCRTKYQISDEKIRGKILTIRCKKCSAKILVRESLSREGGTAVAPIAEEEARVGSVSAETRSVVGGEPQVGGSALRSAFEHAMHGDDADDMPTTIAPTPALEAAGVEWYVAIDGEQSGPFAFAELVRKVQAKEVIGRHYVWHDGMDGWKRVREVNDLSPYLGTTEKKKPPPPPPASTDAKGGAEVVDFASKRKEREQRKGQTGDLVSGDIEKATPNEEGPHHEMPTEGKVEPKSPGREEQLDSVLNEALGIENEGKTARATPGAVAVSKTTSVAGGAHHPPSIDDLSFSGDDLFANLPRASQADVVVKESTRFFVAAAGVNEKKKRHKQAQILGGVGASLFVAFMISWAVGIIQINIPGIGNPFDFGKAKPDEELVDDLDLDDPDDIRRSLEGLSPEERARREKLIARRRKARQAQRRVGPGEGGYITDSPNAEAGTRGRDGEPLDIVQIDPLTGLPRAVIPDAKLPDGIGDANVPAVDSAVLSQDVITRVINEKKKSVSTCYQKSLRGNEELRGKLEFVVTIEPTGAVSRASVETTQFKGTELAKCISSKIKEWKFPKFVGESQQVTVPFVLEKSSY